MLCVCEIQYSERRPSFCRNKVCCSLCFCSRCTLSGRGISFQNSPNPQSGSLHFSNTFNMLIGAWRAKREIVSFRVVRACARCLCEVRSGEKVWLALFPFPFSGGRFSLFPLPSKVLSSFSWLYRYFAPMYPLVEDMSESLRPDS